MNRRTVLGKHVFFSAALAKEGHIPEAEHVEGGQKRSDQPDKPREFSAVGRKDMSGKESRLC